MSSKSSEDSGQEVASPCRRQCCLDGQDICLGCGRTLQEILDWGNADMARKRAICAAAEARLQQHHGIP
ncbi:DUF1289 domain-containing protein [Pseudomonas sp. 1928-m]|uniref:DUF1289 domain-containing protein n=1 Tax=Pseudomonas sp. 1928-m TaxID=3033804 RepID=UPI0023DEDC53|nr:DUF1289 domain-containing protein [Pseudomonas sp. 1928-m]MDF3195402.1 DUF1289 domain-containing protein [Pseudomonas sp. 1928-m]MDZ4332753.1 DUF1289 domain-containing protein [Pseudomonas sp.]